MPIALTFVAVAIGWAATPPVAAGPPPPGGPPPLGGPPVPPPHSPIATFRRSSSSASVRGYCGATAAGAAVCVIVWVVVMLVPVMLCEKSLLAMLKNGVCMSGVAGARGSFMFIGLFRMVMSSGSCSGSESLCRVRVGTSTS